MKGQQITAKLFPNSCIRNTGFVEDKEHVDRRAAEIQNASPQLFEVAGKRGYQNRKRFGPQSCGSRIQRGADTATQFSR